MQIPEHRMEVSFLIIPYHPQSSGRVERMSKTLKEKSPKRVDENKSWIELLPAILAEIRMTPNTQKK